MSAAAVVDAYVAGDPGQLALDVVLRVPAKSSLAGVHVGREAVLAALAALGDRSADAEPRIAARFDADGRVLVFTELRVGATIARQGIVYHVRDGAIAEIDLFSGYADDVTTAPLRR